jgi:putative toxin-antitoxin system antitoxin component (TIGR02293 family)
MLMDYDAKGVADVMGIAFLRDTEARSEPPAAAAPSAKGTRPVAGTTARKSMIFVEHGPTRIVCIVSVGAPGQRRLAWHDPASGGVGKAKGRVEIEPPTAILIEKALEIGLPRRALRHVAETLAGKATEKISALEWTVVPRTTLERRAEQLSPQESERTERVARLFVHARRALGTEDEARDFMTKPHPQLDGRSPIDAARTDLGTRRAAQILNALEYGLAL